METFPQTQLHRSFKPSIERKHIDHYLLWLLNCLDGHEGKEDKEDDKSPKGATWVTFLCLFLTFSSRHQLTLFYWFPVVQISLRCWSDILSSEIITFDCNFCVIAGNYAQMNGSHIKRLTSSAGNRISVKKMRETIHYSTRDKTQEI